MIARIQLLALALGLVTFTATGCKKQSPATTTGSASTGEVSISSVDVGRRVGSDKRVTDKADTFSPRDTIYASVVTSGSAPTATVSARWTYQDGGQVVKEDSRSIVPNGTEATEFHISKPSGWPAGKYQLTITVGGSTQSKDFTVK
jgi:hypothetical protein